MPDKTIIRLSTNPEGFGEIPDELTEDMFASKVPTQHSHEFYEDEDIGLYIGVWDTDDMVEAAGPYGCDELMWLIEGEAEIKNNRTGATEKARAGEAFIIPKGYDCQWHQTGYLRKFFVISEHPEEAVPEVPAHEGIIIPTADAATSTMTTAAPFTVREGAAARGNIFYTDTTGRFMAGTWTSEAFDSEARPFPYNEFAYVQAGSISLTDAAGTEHMFNTGDALFIPEGVVCGASIENNVTLFFAIVHPA